MNKPGVFDLYTLKPCKKCENKTFKQMNPQGTLFKCIICGESFDSGSDDDLPKTRGISPNYQSKGISPK